MPSLALEDRLIWFAHCPKAGGTSVEEVMVAHWGDRVGHLHWGWDMWWRRGGWRHADPPNSPQHLTWEDALAALPRRPDSVFALVRDPKARMLSEYHYQRRRRRGTWTARSLAHLPFPLWLRLMLAMARQNPHTFDNHFRPQVDFIPDQAAVFRLEDGLEAIFVWLGLDPEGSTVPHQLKSGARTTEVAAADLSLIERVFSEDYSRFGYPRAGAETQPRRVLDLIAESLSPLFVWLDRRGRL